MYRVIVFLLLASIVLIGSATAQVSSAKTGESIDNIKKHDQGIILQGGDIIEEATVIGMLPYTAFGTTAGYYDDYDEVCPYSSFSPDVAYSYTPFSDEVIDISLCHPGTDYDTKLYVYENYWDPGYPYACVDDACPGYVSEIIDLYVYGGNTYYIVIDGYGGEFGDYELAVTTLTDIEYTYIRGDVDNDGDIDMDDVGYLNGYLMGGPSPPYEVDGFYPAADVNGDCSVSGSDLTWLVQYVEMPGTPLQNCMEYPPLQYGEVIIGNIDGSPMEVYAGEIVDIPIWAKTSRPMRHLHIPLSTDDLYVSARLGGSVFSPLNGWDYAVFETPDEDMPETGFTSQSLVAWLDPGADPGSYLNTNGAYQKIAEFTIQISTDPSIVGDVIQFFEGYRPGMEGIVFGDETGHYYRAFASIESDVIILSGVSLDYISGIGNVTYMGEGITVRPSLTISSTIYTSGDMFFIEITDEYEYVVYTNTVYARPIAEGTNVIEFDTDWVITSPGTYEAFAEFTSADDYAGDNSGHKRIIVTDFAYDDLPPSEGFDEGFLASLPEGFTVLNEDEEDPAIWAIITGDKYRSPNSSVAVLGGGVANQWEWLIQGPINLSAYLAPAVYFWEDERYWGDYAGEMHEFYASVDTFDIENVKAGGLLLTHTPETHSIPSFTGDSVLVELSGYGGNEKVYFAWRYVSNGDNPAERHQWFIDDIRWADMGYIPGDVNGDGQVIGGDVSYLVAYFVSGGDPPNPFWAGDTNGDCNLIGGDVSYLVNYFVGGGPAPVRGDCR